MIITTFLISCLPIKLGLTLIQSLGSTPGLKWSRGCRSRLLLYRVLHHVFRKQLLPLQPASLSGAPMLWMQSTAVVVRSPWSWVQASSMSRICYI